MLQWITQIIQSAGYLGLFFLMFLENVFPPVPSEVILPMGGYVAGQGKLSFLGVVFVGALGSTIGSLPFYFGARKLGFQRVRKLAEDYGHWVGVKGEDIDKSRYWFDAHRELAVLLGRLVPGIRSLVAVPAGINGMSLPRYCAYTFIGSAVWSLVLVTAGYWLGDSFMAVDKFMGPVSWIVIGGLIAYFVFRGVREHVRKHGDKGSALEKVLKV